MVFVKNIGPRYDFEGGGVVSGMVCGGGGSGPDPKKKSFNRILIHLLTVNVYIIFLIKCIRFWCKLYLNLLKFVKIKNAVSSQSAS